MKKQNSSMARNQQGAFLTEFVIVASFILVPLALMFPVVFKYVENNQFLDQGARYSVWERTAHFESVPKNKPSQSPTKTSLEISREVQNRVFAGKDTLIRLNQSTSKAEEKLNPNFMVTDLTKGKREVMFVNPNTKKKDIPFYFKNLMSENEPKGMGSKIGGALGKVLDKAPGFDINTKGLYQSTVSVELKNYKWFKEWDKLKLTPSRTNALLADGWTIGGPERVKKETAFLVPIGTVLDKLKLDSVLKIFSILPIAKEFGWTDFGKIEPDAVPCVHLAHISKKGKVSTPTGCFNRMKKQLRTVKAKYKP